MIKVKRNIFLPQVLGILSDPIDEARIHSITYSALFVVVGVVVGLSMFLQADSKFASYKKIEIFFLNSKNNILDNNVCHCW